MNQISENFEKVVFNQSDIVDGLNYTTTVDDCSVEVSIIGNNQDEKLFLHLNDGEYTFIQAMTKIELLEFLNDNFPMQKK